MIYTCKPRKISIYINTGRKTVAQVKAETGCDAIIKGGLFDGAFRPVCHLKANGKVLAADPYGYWGYGWDENDISILHSNLANTVQNYIACVCMVRNGQAETLIYPPDMGGARQRTAIGRYPDGRLWLYCDKTGKTPEQLQQIALNARLDSAIMLDGGGSTQGVFPSGTVTASRIVHNFICVWADDEQKKGGDKKMKVCLDPGHGARETNQSPDGAYIEHKFALNMANRIRGHLVRCGVDVKLTREDSSTPSLTERANIANAYKADLFVSLHSNAVGGSGWSDNTRGLTVWTYAAGGERDRAAKLLLAEMKQLGIQTFGTELYHQKFAVLAKTNMPAYLIEYAFHTSRNDVALLLDDNHRDKLALATAKAICVFGGVKWIDAPTATTKPADGTIYRVQVGAFSVEENAVKLQQELENKGYKPYITEEKK